MNQLQLLAEENISSPGWAVGQGSGYPAWEWLISKTPCSVGGCSRGPLKVPLALSCLNRRLQPPLSKRGEAELSYKQAAAWGRRGTVPFLRAGGSPTSPQAQTLEGLKSLTSVELGFPPVALSLLQCQLGWGPVALPCGPGTERRVKLPLAMSRVEHCYLLPPALAGSEGSVRLIRILPTPCE